MYRIEVARSALKSLARIPQPYQRRIRDRIRTLATNPRPPGVKKLRGDRDYYRIRIGDYRVLYTVNDKERIVRIAVIAHRREAYR